MEKLPTYQPATVVQELTAEHVNSVLKNLFNALADATDDAGLTVEMLEKVTAAIQANPAGVRSIVTPENMDRADQLATKVNAGYKPKVTDLLPFIPGASNIAIPDFILNML